MTAVLILLLNVYDCWVKFTLAGKQTQKTRIIQQFCVSEAQIGKIW